MALSQSPSLPKRRTTKGFGGTYMTKLRLKSRWTTVGKIYYWISLKIHVQLMLFSQTRRVQSGGRELRPPCGQEGHHQDEVRQGALLVPVLLNSWCGGGSRKRKGYIDMGKGERDLEKQKHLTLLKLFCAVLTCKLFCGYDVQFVKKTSFTFCCEIKQYSLLKTSF